MQPTVEEEESALIDNNELYSSRPTVASCHCWWIPFSAPTLGPSVLCHHHDNNNSNRNGNNYKQNIQDTSAKHPPTRICACRPHKAMLSYTVHHKRVQGSITLSVLMEQHKQFYLQSRSAGE